MSILLGSVIIPLVVEYFKRHPKIPLSPTNIVAIRSVTAILSVLMIIGNAIVAGDLAALNWEEIINKVIDAVTAFFTATGFYKLVVKNGK